MFENYSKAEMQNNITTIMTMEYLGIHIEDVRETTDDHGVLAKTIYYFSVPETSIIELDNATDEINNKIKCADGLISMAKEEIINMLLEACESEFGDDKEFVDEVKNNISDYFKFYAKVRKGEQWNREMGEAIVKKLTDDIVAASAYKEV